MSDTPNAALTASALRTQFPVLEAASYFNHAAIGPWPRCAAEAVQAFAEENQRRGPAGYPAWIRRERELRRALAALTGAPDAGDIALLKNTSEGISLVAWGLDWRDGDNVVLPRDEFASNRLPWLAQRQRGVEAREIDIRAADDAEAALIAAIDARTRLVAVSSVQWSDGFRLDLERLGDACHRRGVLFFVDAIQQLGALPIDVAACRIDYLAADAHKWLLGPEGIAVFYSSAAARPLLELLQQGWHMFDDSWNFQRTDWTPTAGAKRFEAGSPNSIGQAALHASAGLLLEYGMEAVGQRVLRNTAQLIERLQDLPGLRLISRSEPERRSGIVNFAAGAIQPAELNRRLAAAGVACAVRGDGIRLSPHFYHGEAEIERFFEVLEEVSERIHSRSGRPHRG
jgi:selenocysteine lyase/cysteine desulfurase